METSIQTFIGMCQWGTSSFLVFSSNVFGELIYYSHFFALILSLAIGILVFFRDRKSLLNQLLFLITVMFSLWVFLDLVVWATEKPEYTMFFWSLMILVEPLVYALCLYFVDVFVNKKDISLKKKFGIFLPLLPIIILLPTKFVLQGFDLTNCNRDVSEGFIAVYYVYLIEIFYSFWILLFLFKEYRKAIQEMKKQILFIMAGIVMFLISFVSGNIIGSLTDNWVIAQIGLFGMPIFVGFLAYMIVKFKSFNIKLIGTQVLVFVLGFLVLAILFIRNIGDVRIVVGFTLLFVIALGYALVKSVKKEVEQKEELAKLNIDLQELLKQRESLVHLVTHKVKGSFTRSKYIFAGMLDGMFGDINEEVKKRAQQGLDSDNMGIETVDLVLNAANLEKGTVKYDMKNINFRELVESSISDKKISIEAKGLKLETEIKPARQGGDDTYNVLGDVLWLKEVSNNLIENALKYTREGKITVGLEKKDNPAKDGARKILFYVKDTGIGVTPEDKANLFTEGGRGKESVKINVDSTGYGLYSVRLIVDAHKGKVWMEPNKEANGSVFFVELDAV
ncbi:MAG: ATP-binding protein [Candidatus Nomurabacteria bacterium]|nr:ATP-binding protein [Candidatus Nomurabacteria bacterium]